MPPPFTMEQAKAPSKASETSTLALTTRCPTALLTHSRTSHMLPHDDVHLAGKYYSIDVECVANGPTHNDRVVAQASRFCASLRRTLASSLVLNSCGWLWQVALVDQWENVVLDFYVKPNCEVCGLLSASAVDQLLTRYCWSRFSVRSGH